MFFESSYYASPHIEDLLKKDVSAIQFVITKHFITD